MKPHAIEFDHVWFSYDRTTVLEDITFTLEQGDFLGILGPNGGGKTTLLRLMLGLLKPDKGRIRILGQEPHEATRRVGYLPQDVDFNRAFPVSVTDVALMGRLSRTWLGKRYSRKDRDKVDEVLKKVGMWDHRHRPIGKISGGQRQRVFIARALAADPEMLFLDEPTASVDPEFQTDLYGFLKELNESVTVVVITHDVGVISRYIKCVACVNKRLFFHACGEITQEMIEESYHSPVDLVAHGLPHRVLHSHEGE